LLKVSGTGTPSATVTIPDTVTGPATSSAPAALKVGFTALGAAASAGKFTAPNVLTTDKPTTATFLANFGLQACTTEASTDKRTSTAIEIDVIVLAACINQNIVSKEKRAERNLKDRREEDHYICSLENQFAHLNNCEMNQLFLSILASVFITCIAANMGERELFIEYQKPVDEVDLNAYMVSIWLSYYLQQ
jgi:hypothetical protein